MSPIQLISDIYIFKLISVISVILENYNTCEQQVNKSTVRATGVIFLFFPRKSEAIKMFFCTQCMIEIEMAIEY